MKSSGYVAGWDGGGSKTAMQVRASDGSILLEAEAGPLNYNSQGVGVLEQTIVELIQKLCCLPGGLSGCESLCVATAGISNQAAISAITELIQKYGYQKQLRIIGDHEAALYGALGKMEGIVLVSGTGSICFGVNANGEKRRAGGYGHLIDDEGSGYAIGRDILSAAVRCHDGRNSDSVLYPLVLEAIGGRQVEDIVAYTYRQDFKKAEIARLSRCLLPALEQGDQQAISICKKAAAELSLLVLTVAKGLKLEEGELAFLGSILNYYQEIRLETERNIKRSLPGLIMKEPLNNSAAGAAIAALHFLKEKENGTKL